MNPSSSNLFQRIQHIQIISAHLAKNVFAGAYRSAFKGKGMEFEEVREYQEGDDIRSIDWNVTARMNHPFVKNFREERDQTVMLLVDISASTHFGGHHGLKNTLIAELASVLAFSAIKNNDRIGLLLFSDIVEKYLPPQKGTRHVLRIIRELLAFHPIQKGSDLKTALAFLGNVLTKSSICFLISDFLFPLSTKEMAITAAKHDLIGMMVTDPHETHFPDLGLVRIQDLEKKTTTLVDTSNVTLRTAVHQKEIQSIFNKIGADFINIKTDEPYVISLRKFFRIREERRRR